jgi:hypothetical protein
MHLSNSGGGGAASGSAFVASAASRTTANVIIDAPESVAPTLALLSTAHAPKPIRPARSTNRS